MTGIEYTDAETRAMNPHVYAQIAQGLTASGMLATAVEVEGDVHEVHVAHGAHQYRLLGAWARQDASGLTQDWYLDPATGPAQTVAGHVVIDFADTTADHALGIGLDATVPDIVKATIAAVITAEQHRQDPTP